MLIDKHNNTHIAYRLKIGKTRNINGWNEYIYIRKEERKKGMILFMYYVQVRQE
jgi:hypothetical protein